MTCPGNGIYVVQGEMNTLLTAMRRTSRWTSHSHQDEEQDSLVRSFTDLKDVLNQVGDLREVDSTHYLSPFLEVIRSEETTGPITSLALAAVDKFITYGLIGPTSKSVAATVKNISDGVTRARFVGTDQASDGVVLLKILQVLHNLMLSSEGAMLTNESVCEILLSCFKICFELRLNELLRKSSELCLKDMVQLLFMRLPRFEEDLHDPTIIKKLKMKAAGNAESSKGKKKIRSSLRKSTAPNRPAIKTEETVALKDEVLEPKEDTPLLEGAVESPSEYSKSIVSEEQSPSPLGAGSSGTNIVDMQGPIHQPSQQSSIEEPKTPESDLTRSIDKTSLDSSLDEEIKPVEDGPPSISEDGKATTLEHHSDENATTDSTTSTSCVVITVESEASSIQSSKAASVEDVSKVGGNNLQEGEEQKKQEEYVNPQGVRFVTQDIETEGIQQPLVPYGLVCVRELLRFLISLCNPMDKQNTEAMLHVGLSLLTVTLEVGADSIGNYGSLLALIKDEMCRNMFSLLNSERLSIFAADLRVLFLLFESLRTHLKFQLEMYLTKLIDIVVSDTPRITYEHREIALESVVQLWRIPGLVTELYLNYDCDLYCPNLFEDLTKLLSKNAFPVSGLYNTHLLSLDALLTVIDAIESHCYNRILSEKQKDQSSAAELDVMNSLKITSTTRGSRQKISENVPSHEQLMAIKRKKKLLATGTEQFNIKPKKGIQFLQDHHLLSTPLDPIEVVHFLRENPRLDKKMIGEFISNRSNIQILDSFVKSFDFTETRIDEALRLYLETFRLPGEAPLISLLMEQFAEHWHKCNGEPFANADAAFTLAYAVIMLNVDQHNYNVKRQNNPMTPEDFKKNLKKVNGGEDFDEDMLDDVYSAIKSEEIVMPAEQTGIVRENYLWKVLLRRGASKDGVFVHAPNGLFDHDLFSLIWGPTVAALSFVFDKSGDTSIYQKAISGFSKCAMISAHYGMSNDFDNLIISLCKFTTLLSGAETPDNLAISFGSNPKAQLAAKTVFNLARRHGDILREGWKNVLECILQLYRCKLLPKSLIEAEDFIEPSGKISLIKEETPLQKAETGLFSSLYSYIALGASEQSSQKTPSPEDEKYLQKAHQCVKECHIEQLVTDSKFLRVDSLQELIKALIFASHGPEPTLSSGAPYDEDSTVFFLELLMKVIIQNRDRVTSLWPNIRDHMYSLVMGAAACDHQFLMERAIVGLLRLAIRLMRREDMSPIVLQSLRMLLLLKPATLSRMARQIAYGLYELLKTSAANIHTETDWAIVFTLLECVGAGAPTPKLVSDARSVQDLSDPTAKSDGEVTKDEDSGLGNERGYTSDSELSKSSVRLHRDGSSISSPAISPEISPNSTGGWILVGREGDIQPLQARLPQFEEFDSIEERELSAHDPYALVKCCESLAFLVRDVAHITPYNFTNCVRCIRMFVEASLHGTNKHGTKKSSSSSNKETKPRKKSAARRKEETRTRSQHNANPYDADESDPEEAPSGYHQVSIQLLDLMHTLHTRTAQIFRWWAEENGDTNFTSLWSQGWCPLLQGIARLCTDSRRQVRTSAITYLQRALLVHDLQTLTAPEWEACFNKVLFPLLSKLLGPINPQDQAGVEESRMRAAALLSKVFLHHLTPLVSLPTFAALWLTILDFMDKYMHVDKSDLLFEAIPESLKNIILVMESANVFSSADGHSQLWSLTWDRIGVFLPNLKEELFRSHPEVEPQVTNVSEAPSVPEHADQQQTHHVETTFEIVSPQRSEEQPTTPPAASPPPLVTQPLSQRSSPLYQTPATSIDAVLQHSTCLPTHSDSCVVTHPPLYLQGRTTMPQVSLYSSSPTMSPSMVIPSHYFGRDPSGTQSQLFSMGPPLSTPSNAILLDSSSSNIPPLPILSPPPETTSS